MSLLLSADTADAVWLLAADRFRGGVNVDVQPSRDGDTLEVLHVMLTIRDPRQRWVVSRSPGMNPAFAIAEVVWILSGRRDAAFPNYWNPRLPRFAGSGAEYPGAYGYRLRQHFGLDQLDRAYQALLHRPDSRQAVLQIWDPSHDLPTDEGRPSRMDVPCNVCALLKVRNGRLEWTQVARSNDFFLGLPYNFVQFTCLQEILAGWLGVELGMYNHVSDSLHVYKRDVQQLQESVAIATKPNTDVLALSKGDFDTVIRSVERRMGAMSGQGLTRQEIVDLIAIRDAPPAFENFVRVTAADAANRRGWLDLSRRFMAECTNPVLLQLWQRWQMRRLHLREHS